ncbi:hypothetical protein [Candidatus Uabimicrobium sp. HlEnr_7]|uniref:hypothetical protein n=1 Tax=Candidatus Uabimicrobium helgolandensis TaxID=3095367 RepID=UPI0035561D89
MLDVSQIEPVLSGLFRKLPQTIKAVGSNRRPRTANCVEHFFGKFDRFYRLKHSFCDVNSAEKHIRLFMLGYIFAIKANGKPSPLENAGCDVKNIIFYHLFNQPNLMALKQRIALQYNMPA